MADKMLKLKISLNFVVFGFHCNHFFRIIPCKIVFFTLHVRNFQNFCQKPSINHNVPLTQSTTSEFFLNNTNLTFLAFLFKIDIKLFQNQQNIKLAPVGIELITPTIYALQGRCLFHSATQTCVE